MHDALRNQPRCPQLQAQPGRKKLQLMFANLYPTSKLAAEVNSGPNPALLYPLEPVDALQVPAESVGVRTPRAAFTT